MSHLELECQVRLNVSATKRGRVALRLPDGSVLKLDPDSAERLAARLAREAAKARGKQGEGHEP